jgi:hypothetical protein
MNERKPIDEMHQQALKAAAILGMLLVVVIGILCLTAIIIWG